MDRRWCMDCGALWTPTPPPVDALEAFVERGRRAQAAVDAILDEARRAASVSPQAGRSDPPVIQTAIHADQAKTGRRRKPRVTK
jgi:hypothetical protein